MEARQRLKVGPWPDEPASVASLQKAVECVIGRLGAVIADDGRSAATRSLKHVGHGGVIEVMHNAVEDDDIGGGQFRQDVDRISAFDSTTVNGAIHPLGRVDAEIRKAAPTRIASKPARAASDVDHPADLPRILTDVLLQ